MFTAEYEGINSFLVGASKLLLEFGVKRKIRGEKCWELPAPFVFKINNPTARWITIFERKWNVSLAYAESLWLALGRNDLEFICNYLNRLIDFSDDGLYMRGGYGPRLRYYNGVANDYKIKGKSNFNNKKVIHEIDQYKFIVDCFSKDINTRQATINIGDPTKDCFNQKGKLKQTKDVPCTRVLHFMKDAVENRLNLTVFMRSNDILWGASAVNIFNFTFIQEYFAQILGMNIGSYYHVVNNFHYYEDYREKIEQLASITSYKDTGYVYSKSFKNLDQFDSLLKQLNNYESLTRQKKHFNIDEFKDDFFSDWLKVLYSFNADKPVEFVNPILNKLITSSNG